jgi:hypothetical protein
VIDAGLLYEYGLDYKAFLLKEAELNPNIKSSILKLSGFTSIKFNSFVGNYIIKD